MRKNPELVRFERDWGIITLGMDYLPDDLSMAMDAQPATITTGNAGIPAFMLNWVDPEAIRILQAPNEGANILGEVKKGDWTTRTAYFPTIENTGQVAAYGDFSENGRSGANANYPTRQSFNFQTIIEYGDMEVDMAGEARLNWVSENQQSAASTLDKFMDLTYHVGVAGLQNEGLLNAAGLPAALTPSTKAAGGTTWMSATGVQNATATEVYGDVQSLVNSLLIVSKGRIKPTDAMSLVMSPGSIGALNATNAYGKTAAELIQLNYPQMEIKVSARYATAAGNVVQLFAKKFNGKDTGYCAFTEKQRDFPVIRELSGYKQKKMAGTWGFVLRYPIAVAQMLGV
jgi:hypothetical protein